jgi:hypothetical protein
MGSGPRVTEGLGTMETGSFEVLRGDSKNVLVEALGATATATNRNGNTSEFGVRPACCS